MNRTKLLQFCVFVLSFVSILLFTTCEKDPTSPTGNEPQTIATIGPDGGKLETDDFLLQIPAGSFQSETTLSLTTSDDASSFGESSVSESIAIEGIPDEFGKPLRIAIKYNGELSDSTYIAYGEINEDYFIGDSSVVYQFISVKDSAGFLVGKINPRQKSDLNKGFMKIKEIDLVGNIFQAITKYGVVTTNNEHFEISYPKILYSKETVQEFGDLLEELHEKVKNDLGINFHFKDEEWCNSRNVSESCWIWPVPINIKNVENKISAGLNKSKDPITRYGPYINIDGILLGSSHDSEARMQIGKNLFALRLITMKYDTYYLNERKWLAWAIYGWLDEHFQNDNSSQITTGFEGNELAPFNGLQFGNFIGDSHGQGMVSMIKYLVDKNILALNKIGGIFNKIHEQNIHPVTALLSNVNALVSDWWPDYFESLIDGKIYSVNSSVYLNSNFIYDNWNYDPDDVNIKVFSASDVGIVPYPDLSAKMFTVNLNHSNINESARLYFDAYLSNAANNDGVATIVFSVKNNNLTHVVTAKNSATVLPKNLKEYYDEGIRQFLVVVVNSTHNATDYIGTTDIDLVMEVKIEENDYNYCSVSVRTNYDIHDDGTLWGANDFSADRTIDHGYNGNLVDGIFTGTAYPTDQFGNTYTGSISVNLNSTINDFSMELTENKYIENHTLYWGKNVTEVGNYKIQGGSGIQSISDSQYKIEGSTTCSHITKNNFTRYLEIINPYSGTLENTVNESSTNSYSCNGGSYISIIFSKQ